jgi:ParB-like chromosome segregation protein Spo0J
LIRKPVLVDRQGSIIAGHGCVEAAQSLGMADISTVCVDRLSPAQIRAHVIADNRIAENAGWDRELLALERAGKIDCFCRERLAGA